jgi:hypothetical protein
VVDSFGYLFRHIHPNASKGKLLAQLVDHRAAMARSGVMNFKTIPSRVIA